jgi:transcriptional regulator
MKMTPSSQIDLGLAVLAALRPAHVTLTQEDIAEVCGCTKGAIWFLEKRAMQKLRRRVFLHNDPELRRLWEELPK